MKLLREALEEKAFDLRLLDRNIRRGIIKTEDVKKMRADLEDDADLADYTSLDELEQSAN
jgi:hypothetical protein